LDEKIEPVKNEEKNEKVTEEKNEPKKPSSKDEIKRLSEEVERYKEDYLRSMAELENFKKRMNEEKIKDRKYAATTLIHNILVPLEQLKKVVAMKPEDERIKNFLIGFKMISDKIFEILKLEGLVEIEALNQKFNPEFHYAVEKAHDNTKENGIVIEVIQDGYMYKDRILKPAMVKINEWSENNNE